MRPDAQDVRGTARPWTAYLPLGRGIASFLLIYGFYALASTGLVPVLLQYIGRGPQTRPRPFAMSAAELTTTLYWAGLAVLAGAIALGIAVSAIVQLRRNLGWTSFRAAIAFLTAMSFLAAALLFDNPVGILKLPQVLTCADPALISVDRPFACGRSTRVGMDAALHWRGADWFDIVLRIKLFLNISLSIAAVFVIGSMLIISSTSRMARRPLRFYARMNRNGVLRHLLVAGAVTLSMTTFTDVMLMNWPVHAVHARRDAEPDAQLVGLMTAFTFFYAVLGSIVLGMAISFSREFSFRKVAILTPQDSTALSRVASRAGGLLFTDGSIKALVALSPVFTVVFGHPLVKRIVAALGTS